MLVAVVVGWACSPADPSPPAAPSIGEGGRWVSPSPGARVRVGVLPLVAELPPWAVDQPVQLALTRGDRRWTVDDPLAVVRSAKRRGEMLATLDLNEVPPGPLGLEVVVSGPEGPRSLVGSFTWDRPARRIEVAVVDGAGAPVEARVIVVGPDGPLDLGPPDAAAFDPTGRDAAIDAVLTSGGTAILWLDSSPHDLLVARGVRDDVVRLEVPPDGDQRLVATVARVVPTGERAYDLHIHGSQSRDSHTPDRLRWRSLLASGLDGIVLSDHNLVSDPGPAQSVVDPDHRLHVVTGTEARMGASGDPIAHYNVFPLAPGAPLPPMNSHDPAAHWSAWRARADVVIQLNHPRGMDIGRPGDTDSGQAGLFMQRGLAPADPTAWASAAGALDFDTLEIANRSSWPLYLASREDWFVLLRYGVAPTATGNSDSHAVAVELAGFPCNLVDVGEAGVVPALRAGRVSVTTGPVVSAIARTGAAQAGPGGVLTGLEVQVEAVVRAAPWVPVHEVRLVVDGVVVAREALDPSPGAVARGTFTWPVTVHGDAFVLVEAGWPIDDPAPAPGGAYALVAPGYVPFGFTNPIFLDGDGDGRWHGRALPPSATDVATPPGRASRP